MLPANEVKIKSLRLNDIGLGKSIYTKKQLDEFAALEDSQSTRRAYLTETVHDRHHRMGSIPMYNDRALPVFMSPFLMVWGFLASNHSLPEGGHHHRCFAHWGKGWDAS